MALAMRLLVFAVIFLQSGCGTVNTVFRTDEVASRKLTEKRSYCDSIPRVYSGVSYDFCTLHGKPSYSGSTQNITTISGLVLDFALSGVADTLLLPYTIYRQVNDGSIPIKKGAFDEQSWQLMPE